MLTARPDKSVLEAGTPMRDVPSGWRRAHHQRSLQPISTDSLDKWRNDLSALEIAIVEGAA